MAATWDEVLLALQDPLYKRRDRYFSDNLNEWLKVQDASRDLAALQEFFRVCILHLYLTDGRVNQRYVSVGIAKLTRDDNAEVRAERFTALFRALLAFWPLTDVHRVPKMLALVRIVICELLYNCVSTDYSASACSQMFGLIWTELAPTKTHFVDAGVFNHVINVWLEEFRLLIGRNKIAFKGQNSDEPAPESSDEETASHAITQISFKHFMRLQTPIIKALCNKGTVSTTFRCVVDYILNQATRARLYANKGTYAAVVTALYNLVELCLAAKVVQDDRLTDMNNLREKLFEKLQRTGAETLPAVGELSKERLERIRSLSGETVLFDAAVLTHARK